jgi:hypothetical protein
LNTKPASPLQWALRRATPNWRWSWIWIWCARRNEASREAPSHPPDAAAHPLQRARRIGTSLAHPQMLDDGARDIADIGPEVQDHCGMTWTCDGPPAAHSPHRGTRRRLACDRSTSNYNGTALPHAEDHGKSCKLLCAPLDRMMAGEQPGCGGRRAGSPGP